MDLIKRLDLPYYYRSLLNISLYKNIWSYYSDILEQYKSFIEKLKDSKNVDQDTQFRISWMFYPKDDILASYKEDTNSYYIKIPPGTLPIIDVIAMSYNSGFFAVEEGGRISVEQLDNEFYIKISKSFCSISYDKICVGGFCNENGFWFPQIYLDINGYELLFGNILHLPINRSMYYDDSITPPGYSTPPGPSVRVKYILSLYNELISKVVKILYQAPTIHNMRQLVSSVVEGYALGEDIDVVVVDRVNMIWDRSSMSYSEAAPADINVSEIIKDINNIRNYYSMVIVGNFKTKKIESDSGVRYVERDGVIESILFLIDYFKPVYAEAYVIDKSNMLPVTDEGVSLNDKIDSIVDIKSSVNDYETISKIRPYTRHQKTIKTTLGLSFSDEIKIRTVEEQDEA